MEMKLEGIVLPVLDVDAAKAFYRAAGFHDDLDYAAGTDFRVVQLTPPGSSASIIFGTGITAAAPGSVGGLQLVVRDIGAVRAELVRRGVDVTDVYHDIGGVFYHASPAWEVPGRDPAGRDHTSFARFIDPDGNGWVLHEVPSRRSP